jgi:hypothetical protein
VFLHALSRCRQACSLQPLKLLFFSPLIAQFLSAHCLSCKLSNLGRLRSYSYLPKAVGVPVQKMFGSLPEYGRDIVADLQ